MAKTRAGHQGRAQSKVTFFDRILVLAQTVKQRPKDEQERKEAELTERWASKMKEDA